MPETDPAPLDTAFLDTAAQLGAQLCRDALWDGKRCNWVGASMEFVGGNWRVVQRSFGPEVYAGTAGTSLFLARLAALTDETEFRRTAEGAARQALSRADDILPSARAGYYVGHVGITHALVEVAALLDRPGLREAALTLTDGLVALDLDEQGLDVLAGVAGAIPALLDLRARTGREDLLALARRCGDRLLATARRSEQGWSWGIRAEDTATPHLTGFSHGAGGIAWALLELHRATGAQQYRAGAEGGFAYERSHFNASQQNWPDLREQQPGAAEEHFMVAWCHGAAGIGLSRLRALELGGDAEVRQEALSALATTSASIQAALAAPGSSFSLCHGLAGNAELLLEAGMPLNDPAARALAEEVGRAGIRLYHEGRLPWPCGVLGGDETPNLMLGLAGIGHFYLRLHDSQAVPSVLLVRPRAA